MNCTTAKQQWTEILGEAQQPLEDSVRKHLEKCAKCRTGYEEDQRLFAAIRPQRKMAASHPFKERVMQAITTEETKERLPKKWQMNLVPRWAYVVALASFLIAAVAMLPRGFRLFPSPGVHLLTQSVEAMSHIQTVHMVGRMRTLPGDNFELIGTQYSFVPIELWREYGEPSRWRMEKPGRVVVMDGKESELYIEAGHQAMKGQPDAGFADGLKMLLDPDQILLLEQRTANQGQSELSESEAGGIITLTIHQKAKGNFADPWALNKSIAESDHTSVYKFDAESKRLKELNVFVNRNGGKIEVLEISSIRYDEPLPSSLFALNLPEDVNWLQRPEEMKGSASFAGPRDVAEFFLKSLASKDWNAVQQVLPESSIPGSIKEFYGGLQIHSIGKPVQSGLYPGFYVPYEIQLASGEKRSHRLAVRNDNSEHRWYVDGGY